MSGELTVQDNGQILGRTEIVNASSVIINPATEETVSQLVMAINNAIDQTAYDLNAASFSETTNIVNDYELDSVEFNFSTTEAKTITITSSDGTILWGGDVDQTAANQGYLTTAKHFYLGFNHRGFDGGDNITVTVTQFASPGTMDCILRTKSGTNSLLGNPSVKQADDFFAEVALGNIQGYSAVHKFGNNEAVGAIREDIWDGGGTYPWPANGTSPITHLYSTGADVQPIEVQGLDINGALVVQTKTLTGTTVVALDTPLWRVFRLKNIGDTDIINIVHASDSGKATSYAQIINGNNQTLMALYTIPKGKHGLMLIWTDSTNKDKDVNVEYFERPFGQVFQLKSHHHIFQDFFIRPYKVPRFIPEKTDIVFRATNGASEAKVSATFDLLLVDM